MKNLKDGEQKTVTQKPKFAIGDNVQFGDEIWQVRSYHLIGRHWEVMFQCVNTGKHHSIDCKQLERYHAS